MSLSSVTRLAARRVAANSVGAVRCINLHEYQSKDVLDKFGVRTQKGAFAARRRAMLLAAPGRPSLPACTACSAGTALVFAQRGGALRSTREDYRAARGRPALTPALPPLPRVPATYRQDGCDH
jgi:hypothetical protein